MSRVIAMLEAVLASQALLLPELAKCKSEIEQEMEERKGHRADSSSN